jgi:hypothetical protein
LKGGTNVVVVIHPSENLLQVVGHGGHGDIEDILYDFRAEESWMAVWNYSLVGIELREG